MQTLHREAPPGRSREGVRVDGARELVHDQGWHGSFEMKTDGLGIQIEDDTVGLFSVFKVHVGTRLQEEAPQPRATSASRAAPPVPV